MLAHAKNNEYIILGSKHSDAPEIQMSFPQTLHLLLELLVNFLSTKIYTLFLLPSLNLFVCDTRHISQYRIKLCVDTYSYIYHHI